MNSRVALFLPCVVSPDILIHVITTRFYIQNCVHRSKPSCQTLKHFENVFATGGNNIVEVFESLTGFLNDGHTVV
jgi:hypothetical protein